MSKRVTPVTSRVDFIKLPVTLLSRPEISLGAKLVYSELCNFAHGRDEAFPRQDTIAVKLGISVRAVHNYIKELEQHQLIESVQIGKGMPNKYYFLEHEWTEGMANLAEPSEGSANLAEPDGKPCRTRTADFAVLERQEMEVHSKREDIKDKIEKNDIKEVFEYWQAKMSKPKAKMTPERIKHISARISQGYSVQDLKLAIDGCYSSPFWMGQNDRSTPYNDIDNIMRTGKRVEELIALLTDPVRSGPKGTQNNAKGIATDETRAQLKGRRI